MGEVVRRLTLPLTCLSRALLVLAVVFDNAKALVELTLEVLLLLRPVHEPQLIQTANFHCNNATNAAGASRLMHIPVRVFSNLNGFCLTYASPILPTLSIVTRRVEAFLFSYTQSRAWDEVPVLPVWLSLLKTCRYSHVSRKLGCATSQSSCANLRLFLNPGAATSSLWPICSNELREASRCNNDPGLCRSCYLRLPTQMTRDDAIAR